MPVSHRVVQGECIASISLRYGFFPGTIWSLGENAGVRRERGDGHVLLPGDIVAIPDKRTKEFGADAERRHRFRRRGVPNLFRLQLLDPGRAPRADTPYRLEIDGRLFEGKTDGEGWLEHWIPPNSREGKLILSTGEQYPLELGVLDPVTTERGARARLFNLRYLDSCAAPEGAYLDALRRFQEDEGLPADAELNEPTRDALVRRHAS